jgi:hypothetical protein
MFSARGFLDWVVYMVFRYNDRGGKTMKKALFLLLLVLLSACAPSATTATLKPFVPTENYPACLDMGCIKQAFATVEGGNIRIQFDLTNGAGLVEVGGAPSFTGKQLIALYLLGGNNEEVYLSGFNMPDYSCYAGNDIPWAGGKYAAACGFSYPIAQLAVSVKSGDKIRVENATYKFSQVITIQ